MPFANSRKQLEFSLLLLFCVIAVGTLGYMTLEGWTLFDSLYMTVITITTIGYQEVHGMTPAGRGFTLILICFSLGVVFYSLNNAGRALIEGELHDMFGRRRIRSMIRKMKNHYIVCGHGRMGKIIAAELSQRKTPFVVIERSISTEERSNDAYPILHGDATKDDVLMDAGIVRAKGLISVLSSDAENLYVVLSARELNPALTIVARAIEEGSERKLMRAGANRVVSPYHIGGLRIAHTVLKPAVVDFIEFTTQSGGQGGIGLQMEELHVTEGAPIANCTLGECGIGRELKIIIIAIKKRDGTLKVNPAHDTLIEPGDVLVAIGEEDKLERLEERVGHHAHTPEGS